MVAKFNQYSTHLLQRNMWITDKVIVVVLITFLITAIFDVLFRLLFLCSFYIEIYRYMNLLLSKSNYVQFYVCAYRADGRRTQS